MCYHIEERVHEHMLALSSREFIHAYVSQQAAMILNRCTHHSVTDAIMRATKMTDEIDMIIRRILKI